MKSKLDAASIVVIILIIALIIWVVDMLTGSVLGSSYELVILALIIANLGYSFSINSRLSDHLGWHRGTKKKTS